jgi:hypothetical protein
MLAAAVMAATASIPVLGVSAAHAESYRYWSYWHADGGSWRYSQVGAGGWRVSDGSVEGWHFATSPNTRSAVPPRYDAATAFSGLCGDTAQPAGKVRVAVVLDFGVAADYPRGDGPPAKPLVGDCFVVPERSTGVDVLNAADVSIRDDAGLVCALAGHPATGCGEVVPDADPVPTKPTKPAKPTHRPTTVASPSPTAPDSAGRSTPGRSPTRTPAPSSTAADEPLPASEGASKAPAAAAGVAATPAPSDSPLAAAAADGGDPDPSPSLVVGLPASSDTGSGTPWPAILVAVVIAALGAGAYWRRSRSS